MDAKKMQRLCNAALKQLQDLETLLSHIPTEQGADKFVYQAMHDVKELYQIAKFETAANVTVEQAGHINTILTQIATYYRQVPRKARKELDGGPDNT